MTTYFVAFEGRLAADPELQHTPEGTAVCNALVLVNHRVRNSAGEWVDAEPSRRYIKAWRTKAERLATLSTGTSVVVIGTAHTESWNHHETGEKRTREIVDVESIGQGVLLPRRGRSDQDEDPEHVDIRKEADRNGDTASEQSADHGGS